MSELVERYRTYALECVKINISGSQEKMVLLEMAQGWVRLAEKATTNGENDPESRA